MSRIGSEQVRPLLALAAGVLLGAIAGCSFGVNPEDGRFSCEQDGDCGAGFECIPQANREAGLCFATGTCAEDDETCDGKDDDCNGLVDDVSWAGAACESNLPGVCRSGARACQGGHSVCVETASASAELCDGLDNDCDGAIDEDFDLTNDDQHCGACGNACNAGAGCAEGACVEVDCANGLDDDEDGLIDCDDPKCLSMPCSSDDPEHVCGQLPSSWVDGGVSDGGMTDDGGSPDAGEELVGACVPRESSCGNAIDDDGDGLPDCEDPDCSGLACGDAGICSGGTCQ